jgi:tRNA acetyltransferase TAN1
MHFNLIVSTFRNAENNAKGEIFHLLDRLGDSKSKSESVMSGLIVVNTSLDVFDLIDQLRELVIDEPWEIHYILRLLPIEIVIPTRLEQLSIEISKLGTKMKQKDTYRITVEKRQNNLSSREIISAIAKEIKNKVDLQNPDWTILVETIGQYTGISILRQHQIFSSIVEKRDRLTF